MFAKTAYYKILQATSPIQQGFVSWSATTYETSKAAMCSSIGVIAMAEPSDAYSRMLHEALVHLGERSAPERVDRLGPGWDPMAFQQIYAHFGMFNSTANS